MMRMIWVHWWRYVEWVRARRIGMRSIVGVKLHSDGWWFRTFLPSLYPSANNWNETVLSDEHLMFVTQSRRSFLEVDWDSLPITLCISFLLSCEPIYCERYQPTFWIRHVEAKYQTENDPELWASLIPRICNSAYLLAEKLINRYKQGLFIRRLFMKRDSMSRLRAQVILM